MTWNGLQNGLWINLMPNQQSSGLCLTFEKFSSPWEKYFFGTLVLATADEIQLANSSQAVCTTLNIKRTIKLVYHPFLFLALLCISQLKSWFCRWLAKNCLCLRRRASLAEKPANVTFSHFRKISSAAAATQGALDDVPKKCSTDFCKEVSNIRQSISKNF